MLACFSLLPTPASEGVYSTYVSTPSPNLTKADNDEQSKYVTLQGVSFAFIDNDVFESKAPVELRCQCIPEKDLPWHVGRTSTSA